jgi:hypothetical protein
MAKNNVSTPILQFGSIQVPAVAYKTNMLLKKRHAKHNAKQKSQWMTGVGWNWIIDFIQYGLEPFLNARGYHLGYSHSKAVDYCASWAFSHVRAKQIAPAATVRCMKTYHTGGDAELDWFLLQIPYEDWEQLCYEWNSSEFLDDSDAGMAQQADMPFFVWNLLTLATSPAHGKYLQMMSEEYPEDDDGGYHAIDDAGAFGGDRRTH